MKLLCLIFIISTHIVQLYCVDQNCVTFKDYLSWFSKRKPDIFTDLWGYQSDVNSRKDGWTLGKRQNLFQLLPQMIDQSQSIRKYSSKGYLKMKMPKDLHNLLLQSRNLSRIRIEKLDSSDPNYGSFRIRSLPIIPFKECETEAIGKFFKISHSLSFI